VLGDGQGNPCVRHVISQFVDAIYISSSMTIGREVVTDKDSFIAWSLYCVRYVLFGKRYAAFCKLVVIKVYQSLVDK